MKAKVSIVNIGNIELETLWLGGDLFYVSLDSVCSIFGINTDYIEALGVPLKTPVTQALAGCLPVIDFEKLLLELAVRDNTTAQQMKRDLISLAHRQFFSDAFDIEFDSNDRQQWLKACHTARSVREASYQAIFGRSSDKLCQDLKVDSKDLLRDHLTNEEIRHMERVEALAMRLIDTEDMEPYAAVQEAQKRLIIPVSDRAA